MMKVYAELGDAIKIVSIKGTQLWDNGLMAGDIVPVIDIQMIPNHHGEICDIHYHLGVEVDDCFYVTQQEIDEGYAQIVKQPSWANYEIWEDGKLMGWLSQPSGKFTKVWHNRGGCKEHVVEDHMWNTSNIYTSALDGINNEGDYGKFLVRLSTSEGSVSTSEANAQDSYYKALTEALRTVRRHCELQGVEIGVGRKGIEYFGSCNGEPISVKCNDGLEGSIKALDKVNELGGI